MAKVSLLIYAVFGLALVTAAVLLALASQAFGLTAHVDHFARSVFNIKSLTLRPAVVAEWAAVLAAAVMVVGALLHVLCAFLYNRIVDLTGGIGVHLQRDAAAPTGRQ